MANNSYMEYKVQIKLLEDAMSGNKKLYAKKGDILTLISIFSNVLILQNEDGNKFPVKKEITDYIPIKT